MSFNYDKHKNHSDDGHFWTSYSDLFLGLSTIFLLLYVTSSLRTGTNGMKQQVDNQNLKMEVQDLKAQLKMYDSIKKDYLKKEADSSEEKSYQELMDKLVLLKEEAKDEKEKLRQAFNENSKKEQALNQYQQMVRNMINANVLSKTKIKKRDDIIEEQDDTIDSQDEQISKLNQDVENKKKLIEEGEVKIAKIQENLENKMDALKEALKNKEITKQAYEKRMAQLKQDNQSKIDQLNEANQSYQQELNQTQQKLGKLSTDLAQTQAELSNKAGEASALKNKLNNVEGEYNQKIGDLKKQYALEKERDRKAFDDELGKHKLGAAERAKKEAEFKARAAQKEKEMQDRIAGLSNDLHSKDKELKKALEERDLRKDVAKEIKKGFEKAGIKADIDLQTGEVMLDFGDSYFETGSSKLNGDMKAILEKAMPVYAKSLFGNNKVKDKISAVEIVGFASPTYKGKYVDPNSSARKDKQALKYNMDLSYQRAKSIFNHIIDDKSMEFDHQKDMFPVMKVSGRSFLEVMKVKNVPQGKDFCSINDCKKSQRVIIRFGMDGKK
ncbi:MAG: microtubule-binding protein [Bdellovibrionaceae bacterium]|nr:microtubule-binding protein [Pseudobdellovibrionaceae bacterium]